MRRRPSGSGEDDNGSRSASAAPERLDKSRDSSNNARDRDSAREVKHAASWPLERKPSKDMNRTPVLEIHSPWNHGMEPKLELANDVVVSSPIQPKSTPDGTPESRGQRARMRNPWSCSTLTFATSICAIVLLTTILHSFFTRQQDPKGCAMSYMRPAFTRYSDFDTEHTRFASKYSLYLYREGGVDEDTRVKGIPVLFIPGNAGSYKQVRPIAAEAAHYYHDVLRTDKAATADGKAPLDVFSVDFNEDITAFHGQTLLDQAEYLNEAVAFILALYHNPSRSLRESGLPEPKSVIILGHSMGGVVARTMLRMPNYQEHTVNTIVTLSAPHARAPVTFDADMVATYNDINTYWRKSYLQPPSLNPLADVTLVSVAGGGLDTMIPSESTSLTSLVPDTHGFTVFTSSIPNVWTGMDHLAIMWCDQFRKALVKAVFDVTDVRRSAQTKPQAERIKAIRKRLLTGMEPVVQKSIKDQGTSN
jgi:glycosylphosphatidylinositol deacylase